MAKTLATTMSLKIAATYENDAALNSTLGVLTHVISDALATGTAAEKADLFYAQRRTLAATSEDLDLAGILLDDYRAALTFVKIRGLLIHNLSTTTTENLAVGGAAATQFVNWVGNASDIVNVGPNGILFLWSPQDGYAVTAGTGDLLKIDAGSDTIIYDIIVIGTSA